MRDSARSLMVVFIACAPPVRELMGISAHTGFKSIAPEASRHVIVESLTDCESSVKFALHGNFFENARRFNDPRLDGFD